MPSCGFIGGVDVSVACLGALCRMGLTPDLAIGYDASRVGASGYADLTPLAEHYGFPLLRVRNVNDDEVLARLQSAAPDVLFVIGWSQLIRRPLLDLPPRGCVGIHPTPLPEGRGRAPIPWTILRGVDRSASTMFFLTEGVDDGDVIDRVEVCVSPREDAGTLYAKHREAHVQLIERNAQALLEGTATRHPQDEQRATYWEARRPEDGRIDPSAGVAEVDRLIRAVTRPFPGAFLDRPEGRLTIWRAEPARVALDAPTGAVVEREGDVLLACADGAIKLLEADGLS